MAKLDHYSDNMGMNWQSRVEAIRQVSSVKGREKYGRFSIEGIRLHERALRAGVQLHNTIVAESFGGNERERTLLEELGEVMTVPDRVLNELVNGRSLGEILSLATMLQSQEISDLVTNDALILVAADVVDPGNVGAMVRTGLASGVTAFVATGVSDPFHPKGVRTTMGSLFKLPILRVTNVGQLIDTLQELGVWCVGTAVQNGVISAKPLPKAHLNKRPTAIFMGNEYRGLPKEIQQKLDERVYIPMPNGVDSFSVNAATAVTLYEMNRQKDSGC